jgi:hypothetical protein
VDEAALAAARDADRLLAAARERGIRRWEGFLEPIPDGLRDGPIRDLRRVAMRARAAYGPKDSIRDALPPELTEPFRDSIDHLLRVLARHDGRR